MTTFVIVNFFSFTVFVSLLVDIPKYDSNGLIFITIPLIVTPAMLIITFSYFILNKFFKINKETILLPMVVGTVLGLLVVIGSSLNLFVQIAGMLISLLAVLRSYYNLCIDIPELKLLA